MRELLWLVWQRQLRGDGLAMILSCSHVSGTMKSGLRNDPSSTLIHVSARKYAPRPIPIQRVPRMPFVSTPAPQVESQGGIITVPFAPRERAFAEPPDQPVVLAVSGGADSMVLADDMFRWRPAYLAAVATYDHGTGPTAEQSVDLVVSWARARGLRVEHGRAERSLRSEASWRRARWAFLRESSARVGAPVATAHNEDDQAETVFMRLLRGSGVRGLAGLLAPSEIRRPLLGRSRDDVREYARIEGVAFIEDPSNADLRHRRNRVRRELLPILERENPGFRAWLLGLGMRAAAWRAEVARLVDEDWSPVLDPSGRAIHVRRNRRRLPSAEEGALFWPEVAGRIGVALDWRGTERLSSFTTRMITGQCIPLSGGVRVTSRQSEWSMERPGPKD